MAAKLTKAQMTALEYLNDPRHNSTLLEDGWCWKPSSRVRRTTWDSLAKDGFILHDRSAACLTEQGRAALKAVQDDVA